MNRKYLICSIWVLFSLLNNGISQVIENGSFESAQINLGNNFIQLPNGSNSINGWMVRNGNIDYVGGYWEASDGVRSIDMNGTIEGTISQTFNTTIGETYYIKFDLSGNPECGGSPAVKTLLVSVASVSFTFIFDITGNSVADMRWETKEIEFTAISTSSTLSFLSLTPGSFCGPVIDNVYLCDCAGIPNGTSIIDECGVCIEPNDSNFNGCVDCAGIPNGTSVIDECGICIDPNDPNFNGCVDCAGIPNGTSIIDECGICIEPNAPNFNGCVDCAGIPNGTSIIDECGICIEPNDPSFNESCTEENHVFIPNAFSPNNDGVNDRFRIYKKEGVVVKVAGYKIFSRWGTLLFESKDLDFNSELGWWNGELNGRKMESGIYIYHIQIEFQNGELKHYGGDVTIVK